jgi:hypothetical protein
LATEGPNEPNNFPFFYQGVWSGSDYKAVANFQKDLYAAVKADPKLAGIPVLSSTETGSETSDVGLQFLTKPDGIKFADYINVHNYVRWNGAGALIDNQAWAAEQWAFDWNADGVWSNFGITWRNKYPGYSAAQLLPLPRLTTETGWQTSGGGAISEDQQGKLYLSVLLDAAKLGYKYTFFYLLHEDSTGFGVFNTTTHRSSRRSICII